MASLQLFPESRQCYYEDVVDSALWVRNRLDGVYVEPVVILSSRGRFQVVTTGQQRITLWHTPESFSCDSVVYFLIGKISLSGHEWTKQGCRGKTKEHGH